VLPVEPQSKYLLSSIYWTAGTWQYSIESFSRCFSGQQLGLSLKWIGDNVGKQQTTLPTVDGVPGTPIYFLGTRPGLVLGTVTAAAVAITGANSQYVADPTFSNSNLDYLGLLLWAFAGQLAGQTLIDIAGNAKAAIAATKPIGDQPVVGDEQVVGDQPAVGDQPLPDVQPPRH
jgi:hypothetical protein